MDEFLEPFILDPPDNSNKSRFPPIFQINFIFPYWLEHRNLVKTPVVCDALGSKKLILCFIIWLAPRAGKMNQILRCDWLPERARWSHLARSGLPALSRKKKFPKCHIINPLLTKLVRSRWLDIGRVLFLRVYGPRLRLGP